MIISSSEFTALITKGVLPKDGGTLYLSTEKNNHGLFENGTTYAESVKFMNMIPVVIMHHHTTPFKKAYEFWKFDDAYVLYRGGSKAIPAISVESFIRSTFLKRWMFRTAGSFLVEDDVDYAMLKGFLSA